MGETLEELRKKLAKERAKSEAKKDIARIGRERSVLRKEIKAERFKRKYGKVLTVGKKTGRVLGGLGKAGLVLAQQSQKKKRRYL